MPRVALEAKPRIQCNCGGAMYHRVGDYGCGREIVPAEDVIDTKTTPSAPWTTKQEAFYWQVVTGCYKYDSDTDSWTRPKKVAYV